MTYDKPHAHDSVGDFKRVLAVIAKRADCVAEITAQFAKQGEEVEALWYPDSRQLLADQGQARFEAMILFPSRDEAATDADERALRTALSGTPLYRVA